MSDTGPPPLPPPQPWFRVGVERGRCLLEPVHYTIEPLAIFPVLEQYKDGTSSQSRCTRASCNDHSFVCNLVSQVTLVNAFPGPKMAPLQTEDAAVRRRMRVEARPPALGYPVSCCHVFELQLVPQAVQISGT